MSAPRRLVRIVRRMESPLGGTGWPRREYAHACGYQGRVRFSIGPYGLFVGCRDDSHQIERRLAPVAPGRGPKEGNGDG